jgi:hypothetical protein
MLSTIDLCLIVCTMVDGHIMAPPDRETKASEIEKEILPSISPKIFSLANDYSPTLRLPVIESRRQLRNFFGGLSAFLFSREERWRISNLLGPLSLPPFQHKLERPSVSDAVLEFFHHTLINYCRWPVHLIEY